uniref:Uncharacterized protein n=1 Tax=Kalanchoe fedtschenkoi TaxID=63787 RepID=A0A7N0VCV2_KALFE
MALDDWARALRYDAIRMLIRGSDYSHALGVHICDGCSEFRIYSMKGWASFVPQKNSLVVTLGDQIQVLKLLNYLVPTVARTRTCR